MRCALRCALRAPIVSLRHQLLLYYITKRCIISTLAFSNLQNTLLKNSSKYQTHFHLALECSVSTHCLLQAQLSADTTWVQARRWNHTHQPWKALQINSKLLGILINPCRQVSRIQHESGKETIGLCWPSLQLRALWNKKRNNLPLLSQPCWPNRVKNWLLSKSNFTGGGWNWIEKGFVSCQTVYKESCSSRKTIQIKKSFETCFVFIVAVLQQWMECNIGSDTMGGNLIENTREKIFIKNLKSVFEKGLTWKIFHILWRNGLNVSWACFKCFWSRRVDTNGWVSYLLNHI